MFNNTFKTNVIKLLLSFLPIVWGLFTWLSAWGFLGKIIPYGSYNLLLRVIVGYSVIYLLFNDNLRYAQTHYQLKFWQFKIYLPPWWMFISLNFLAIAISFFYSPIYNYPILESIVLGLLVSSCVEELLTRSIFIKYEMRFLEFLFFNILTSLSFALMHLGYFEYKLLSDFNLMPHFMFSFMLNTLAYKTKRVELTIVLHILSNFLNYTLPVLILNEAINISMIYFFKDMLFYLCLAGCAYSYKE